MTSPAPARTSSSDRPVRIGTRGSPLARWQADWVAEQLRQRGVAVEIVPITTQGDVTRGSLGASGGIGLFTKEIQRELLAGNVDVAVHSLKDLPTDPVEGLSLAAVPPRESPFDVLVSNVSSYLEDLPQGAVVGTGSARRRSQILHLRRDLHVKDIRGNVETRLAKLDDWDYDAIVLAEAGLNRLKLTDQIAGRILPPTMFPAVGQGALGIETRTNDQPTRDAVVPLNDEASRAAVVAERAMLRALLGGCLAPVGTWGRLEDDALVLDGVVLSVDGRTRLAAQARGPAVEAEQLGRQVAESLLSQGAAKLIERARDKKT